MDYFNGEDRILYVKVNGNWLPIGCLTDNSMDEISEMMPTTTRENGGWKTSRTVMQSYNLSFSGLQINTTVAGGNFNVASYDKLQELKRSAVIVDWKVQGTEYPIVNYGKCSTVSLSDSNAVGEFVTFSGTMEGFGKPLTQSLGTTVLNNGDPNVIINNGDPNIILRVNEL